MTLLAENMTASKTGIVAQDSQTGHDFASNGIDLVVPAGFVRLQ
ncbi:hypothetical protein [Marinobacter sp.]